MNNDNKSEQRTPGLCVKGDGFDKKTGGFRWLVVNGHRIDVQFIATALRTQFAAEDAVDPEGLFCGIDSIAARAAIATATGSAP